MHPPTHNDFDGDGRSDVLWRDPTGAIHEWSATSTGAFVDGWTLGWVATANVAATGDFNGDGREDIVLLGGNSSASGTLLISALQTQSAGFQPDWEAATMVPSGWHIAGEGDFNGDSKTDLLMRNDNGVVAAWLIGPADSTIVDVPDAPFVPQPVNGAANSSWHIVGTGDFDGDGISDILWRNDSGYLTDWLGTATGAFTDNVAHAGNGAADVSWQIAGTGDFNGDGLTDILWRNANGYTTEWLGTSNGEFTDNNANAGTGAADASWQVVNIGDFNGDGMDDLLWRNSSGYTTEWLGASNGGFTDNAANAGTGAADNSWHVQDPFV